jgi:hypothetical protein
MSGAGTPGAIAELNLAHLGQPEATPFTSWRQSRLALAAELIGQRFLLPFGVAKNDRAKLAGVSAVDAADFFLSAMAWANKS